MHNALTKWDKRFLDLAAHVASWSKDPSTRVGAVIVDANKRVVSLGFNGFPAGVNDEELPRERKLLRTIHAEINAIAFANVSVRGCTIYVTHAPCANCTANLIQNGIAKVVFPRPINDFKERWADHYSEAMLMLMEAGVEVVEVTEDTPCLS